MKTLHYINLTAFLITFGLYASIHFGIYGMIASLGLGVIQLFLGIVLVVYSKEFSNKHQNYLKIYWILAILNITAIIIVTETRHGLNSYYAATLTFIIPMFIASYFVYLTYQIQKSFQL
ncbi:hypothetical protein JBL43_11800 [Aureibaculum sp. A20]|uniref:Uncharacterized protein n=1 Tax=Aureibaculum flavum TaxID=2795986 RepID=A0ABS0WSJ7_9FLAO|nr:hypothetical protein [Aureibaculum flavum]MBJ2174925.1 hypothetical protein [Aureibaculum flavum]